MPRPDGARLGSVPAMDEANASGTATARDAILGAAIDIVANDGVPALNVQAVMTRAGISRTAFYREFADIHAVVETLIERLAHSIAEQGAAWMRDPGAVGSPDVVYDNLIRSATNIQPWARLVRGLYDAAGLDSRLRQIWSTKLSQPRTETLAAAIRRDQTAGAIRADLDADATAIALYAMSEYLLLDLICRDGADPQEYARITAPIWRAVLFGQPNE